MSYRAPGTGMKSSRKWSDFPLIYGTWIIAVITDPTSTFLGGSGARGGGSGSGIWLFSTWSNSGFNLSSSQVAELLALISKGESSHGGHS